MAEKWGTEGFPRFSNTAVTAVLQSDHLEHPGNRYEFWKQDLHDLKGECDVCECLEGSWGREKLMLQKEGSPFCRERKGRESERG